MFDKSIVHSCGVRLEKGNFDTYHTEQVTTESGNAVVYSGTCPACEKELDPEEDRITFSDSCR